MKGFSGPQHSFNHANNYQQSIYNPGPSFYHNNINNHMIINGNYNNHMMLGHYH